MFIVVYTYRARRGEEDAVVALHEDWERTLRARTGGFLSGELLHSVHDPRAFMAIVRYADEAAVQAAASDPEQAAWQQRLASLTEVEPTCAGHVCVWQVG